ncbi:hypothetical protein ATCC90586_007785 [Pythium insidiosum]|nr:hypothetical protein ATCC90586_007785 [Pythium insidiosum]
MEQLQGVVQNYAWGKRGLQSVVAQLQAAGAASTTGELPFLFKVLSVNKALSIQAHPDLALAKTLHAQFPELYKDPNHKPEMAIALTRFEALCQFRSLDEIVAHVEAVAELRALAGREAAHQLMEQRNAAALRAFFRGFIHADRERISAAIASLRDRLLAQASRSALETLVLRLIDEYDVDIGCFCPYLLNYVTLEPGECVFLSANEPHAYLSGDCIECMACSDNVVRAGLTPKFIDKATLCDMLTYRTLAPAVGSGRRVDAVARLYSPPVPEFEIEALQLPSGQQYELTKRKEPSVLLVVEGTGAASHDRRTPVALSKGCVLLVGAGEKVTLAAETALSAFRAFPNETLARTGDP